MLGPGLSIPDLSIRQFFALAAWPNGADGALNVGSGQTVSIDAGSLKDYSSLTVAPTGTLEITGTSDTPTFIGVSGNFNNQGVIRGIDNGDWGSPVSYSGTAPDGTLITYSVSSAQGGPGGTDGTLAFEPQLPESGNGAGGNSEGAQAPVVDGSAGGTGADGYNGALGGIGGALYSGDGGNGDSDTSLEDAAAGGGGGGGARATNGQVVYFKIGGNIVNAGTILFNGSLGGSGGGGGTVSMVPPPVNGGSGGGGGGGGAGGFGGYVKFLVHGTGSGTLLAAINISGGSGGSAGQGGESSGIVTSPGEPGMDGSGAPDGTKLVGTY